MPVQARGHHPAECRCNGQRGKPKPSWRWWGGRSNPPRGRVSACGIRVGPDPVKSVYPSKVPLTWFFACYVVHEQSGVVTGVQNAGRLPDRRCEDYESGVDNAGNRCHPHRRPRRRKPGDAGILLLAVAAAFGRERTEKHREF
ncbi:MAG: hypothetical protein BJ554DRAFT_1509 [Olpidium bornovanus]|uniref:Uncharacterized protein n=1 Tax=Olpidium bornovanus TaxID=278681 RepID=A0A8H7ZS52_9FUNG|nr:MAG: hypothetical protein BJ554DRAFT_1509 [Olpidium bornovanus]